MTFKKIHRIVGREKEEAILAKALACNKIFPTWIFHGIAGIGKASVALKFAKCLLSNTVPRGNTLDVDLENPVCKLVDSGVHPDFFMLEQTDESISIDDVRKLFLQVRKSPAMSGWRVLILENAANLNKNIYNSLLKILEEPPTRTAIILICDHIGAIPQTLLSRAAQLYFSPLDEAVIGRILEDMDIKNSERLARLAEGSVGQALRLHENNGIEIYDNILEAFFHDGSLYQKTLKWILDHNLCDNFDLIKTSILRILKIYVEMLGGIIDGKFKEEINILEPMVAKKTHPDYEIKKIQEIVLMMNVSKALMLDKNAVMVNVFERFFR
jgi:DNA polymerase-3 subunit delta'